MGKGAGKGADGSKAAQSATSKLHCSAVDGLSQRGTSGDATPAAAATCPQPTLEPKLRHSSGVNFYPPSDKYWRIGGKWYDFTKFAGRHPGGAAVLMLARDRFEDCTFAFEAHHHNYGRARSVIKKYEVPEAEVVAAGIHGRPMRDTASERNRHNGMTHFDRDLDQGRSPLLLGDDAFYSVIRRKVAAHLKEVGHPSGGPTRQCVALFWATFAAWLVVWASMLVSGWFSVAVLCGLVTSWLGAFGHNWVHQPQYKTWAYLSLDAIGFSSDGWFREHILQHHMYTNTPWDNHFHGTDPFLTTDPTVPRNWLQRHVMPYLNPLLLCFGLYANYIAHLIELLKGNEVLSPGKLCLPAEIGLLIYWHGWLHGALLAFTCNGVLGIYYFSMALMNHNAEHCHDVKGRNDSADWGESQLHSSADWGVQLSFLQASRYLWLNYHTVHHLFPRTDFSHHPAIQKILLETCHEFDIKYETADSPWIIYRQMVHAFRTPLSLLQEVSVYGGGL